jgi:mannose-6-phosphate isomerase-like protein (cupin superfamily)
MVHRFVITLAAVVATASAAMAQPVPHAAPPDSFKFLPARDVAALTQKPGPAPWTAYLGDHEDHYVEYAVRTDTGNLAEVHTHWTHYIDILEGTGSLTYGGTVSNPKRTAPGQIRGDAIVGGKTIALHAGDYVQIPAGTPHLFSPAAGTRLRYIVFNARE